MVKWKFKGCPRCKGDMFIDQEADGCYEHCLLCGYVHEIEMVTLTSKGESGAGKKESRRAKQTVLSGSEY